MTDETTKITAKANETMARSSREQLRLTQKVAAGEMTKEEALEILDELEKADTDLIADIDRRIEKLEGELGEGSQNMGEREKMEHFATIESDVRLRIRSRPIWMPRFLYHWLVHRVLVMEYWKE